MSGNVKSAVIAGVIAFVIYTVIALLTGSTFGSAVGVGLIFLVGTAVVTFIIILVVQYAKKEQARP